MPKFEVNVQGAVYEVDAPDETTAWNWANYTHRQEAAKPSRTPEPAYLPVPQAAPETGFIPSVKRGFYQTTSLLGDVLPAMAARAVGADEYAEKQWKEAAETKKMIEERFPQEVPSFTDIKDVKSAYKYVVESVGENLASILPTIFTGGTAGLLTAGARKAALTAAERVAAEDVAKAMAAGPLQEAAVAQIQKKAIDAGIQQARSIALKSDVAGALAGSALQNIPDVYQNIKEKTGKEDLGAALIFGGINAGLDAIMPIHLMQKARKMGVPTDEIGAAFYKRFGKGLVTGFAEEGATEFAQEVSSAAAEKFVDQNQEFFTKENLERFINAGLKGGIGGGVITGTTNVLTGKGPEKAAAPPAPPSTEEEEAPPAPPPAEAPVAPPAPTPAAPAGTAAPTPPPPPPPSMGDILGAAFAAEGQENANAPQPNQQPSGTSTTVAGEPDTGTATEGVGGPDTSGVVSTGATPEQPTGGEGAPTAPVTPPATPPAAPAANPITSDFLDQLGISPQAAIRKKVGQVELGSPELVKSLRGFLINKYVSDDTKTNIRTYLETLKQPAAPAAPVVETAAAAAAPAAPAAPVVETAAAAAPAAPPAPPPSQATGIASAGTETKVGGAPAPAPAPPAPPAASGKPTQTVSIQSKIDDFDAMFGDDGLPSRGTAGLTPAQQAQEARLEAEGNRLGVARREGETAREYWARVKPAMALEGKISAPERGGEGVPLSAVPTTDIAAVAEEAREGKRYKVTPEQRAMYDDTVEDFNKTVGEDEQLPTYEKLRELHPEGLLVYFRDHIKTNSQPEHDDAAAALSEYLSDKKSETRAGGSPQTIQAKRSYERERGAFSAKTGLNYSFPGWNTLSDESQRLFTTLFRVDSAIQQDMAFRAVKNQIQKEKLEAQQAENVRQAETSSTHEMLREAERARERQPAGKGVVLPENILKKLLAGKISGEGSVLEYLINNGKGIAYKGANSKYLNLFSRELFRGLARVLNSIEGFKVNVVYDENMVLDEIGKYDASTNTLYLGPNGLDEATVLHELVHAGTVKIIHQYFTDKSQLSPRAAAAVGHLLDIAAAAKSRIGSKYPNAFENLYEFVAYAFTDLRFQKDLASIRIPSLAKATGVTAKTPTELRVAREIGLQSGQVSSLIDTLWDYFTGTIAYMYRLFYPRGKTTKILLVTEESRLTRATTALEKEKQKEESKRALTKKQQQEIEAEAQRIEKIKEEPITAPEEEEELTAAQKEVLAPGKLFEDPDAISDEEKAEAPVPEKEVFATQYGVTNLRRAILTEPGYKGNLLLEASSALQDILAAPEGGITQLAGKGLAPGSELMAKKTGAGTGKPADTVKIRSAEEITNSHPLGERTPSTNSIRETLTKAYPFIVRKFQNAAAPIKMVQELYEKLGKITHIGPNINNVWSQMTKSSGRAWMNYVNHMMAPATKLNKSIEDFAKSAGLDVKKALQVLHSYAIMLHEPERRMVKYLKTVPLNDMDEIITLASGKKVTPEGYRKMILTALADDKTTIAQAVQLRQALEKIALPQAGQATSKYWAKVVGKANKPTTAEMFDINNLNRYNVAGLNGIEELYNLQKMFAGNQYDKSKLDAAMAALKEVHDATEKLDKEANYRGKGVDNVIAFYGYKNYVPFKGKPGKMKTLEDENRDLDPFASRRIGGDLNEKAFAFGGRMSDSENPFLQSLADGARAALRLGRKELTLSIKNAVDQKILHGDTKTKIPFSDRFLDSDALKETEGETKVLHYEPDGTITVIKLTDKAQREAIRRSYREINPLIEKMNAMTSLVGQTHTRYNIPFAPMNFVRDALTNAFTLGAEFGPQKSSQLIGEVARAVAEGGFHKAVKVSRYLANGNMAQVKAMAAADKTGFTQDLLDYLERGGRVSYLQGLAARSQLDEVVKQAGRNKILQTKDNIDSFFDYWTDTFEFTSRVASYRVLKQSFTEENLKKGMPKAQAEQAAAERATEYAKNLANFEQVGEWGKGMGALFMFFRPAATGAVRAIESLRPVFGFNEEAFKARAKGKASEAEINAAVLGEMKKVESARAMVGALLGMGACVYIMSYMMAGDDDQGRNKTATDDPARWTRYARFFIPGMEHPVQIPWGFGLGSFASTGAQVMSGVLGTSSTKEVLGNIVGLGLDNFFPVPVSRMNPFDNFPAWLMDTSMPSLFRPFLEYVMNVDSLGRDIYNNRQSRVGDAYTGGDSIPEMYKLAARTMFDATLGGVDVSPNTLYFWASNYADGLAKFAATATDLGMVAAGMKSFNPKTNTIVFDSFFGAPSNFDAKQFSSLENQIKALEQRLNTLKQDPGRYAEFVSQNPMAQYVVNYYNNQINGTLKQTRQMMNDIRANRQYDPKERDELINNIKPIQNLVKRNFINTIEQISDLKP